MSRFRDGWRRWLPAVGLIGVIGCDSGTEKAEKTTSTFPGVTIVAATVGDPAILSVVSSQRGEWAATRGGEIRVQPNAVDPKSISGVDVLIFPADRLGDLVDAKALAAIPESLVRPTLQSDEDANASDKDEDAAKSQSAQPDPLQFADVVTAYRDQVSRYGTDRMALPLGASALVLVCDRTAFEREENRKAAAEAKVKLQVPQTWTEFDALAKFFQGRDWNGDGSADHGLTLALGADPEGVADAVYLARAASLGQHRDQYSFLFDSDSMKPRVDSPPFVEALRSWAGFKDFGPLDIAKFDSEAARKAFAQGKTAMLIDRAEAATHWGDHKGLMIAPLPGSDRVYDPARKVWETPSSPNRPSWLPFGGGWLVGIPASANPKTKDAALDFAAYLINPDTANLVRADRNFPMLPVRSTLIGQGVPGATVASGVDSKQWADAVSRTLLALKVIAGLRIPEASGYLSEIAKARAAVLRGEDPEAALKTVADAWTERTKRLGVARQLWHYRRSLNSLVTLPEPPER
ncbi:extracellular solute-binding protein [Singulisphaera sp. PoT]|uniref:extracellular solute-binding protein n=1 Tax=Singulisphaera sp. PoT TaxID=3411797 RepID=UPI003BF4DB47